VKFLAGDIIARECYVKLVNKHDQPFNVSQARLVETEIVEVTFHFCKRDLCNGSGRLAEMFSMTMLLPACLVVASFFSTK
jgi:hypothetical protein